MKVGKLARNLWAGAATALVVSTGFASAKTPDVPTTVAVVTLDGEGNVVTTTNNSSSTSIIIRSGVTAAIRQAERRLIDSAPNGTAALAYEVTKPLPIGGLRAPVGFVLVTGANNVVVNGAMQKAIETNFPQSGFNQFMTGDQKLVRVDVPNSHKDPTLDRSVSGADAEPAKLAPPETVEPAKIQPVAPAQLAPVEKVEPAPLAPAPKPAPLTGNLVL